MKKFTNWLKQGKSRGILIILAFSFVLSILSYHNAQTTARSAWRNVTANPEVQSFLQEFPQLTIKDGKIQGDIVWSRIIPIFNIPIVINSSSTEVSPNAQSGIYVTQTQIIFQDQGKQAARNIPTYDEEVLFSLSSMLEYLINYTIPTFSAVTMFLLCVIFFAVTILLSLAIACIARIQWRKGCLWRTSMISSIITLTFSILLSLTQGLNLGTLGLLLGATLLSIFIPGSQVQINILPICFSVVLSVLLLYWINRKKKEI